MAFSTRRAVAATAALAGASMLLAACAPAPENNSSSAKSDFKPCMVSDSGGFNDKSFNELGKDGLDDGAKALGVTKNVKTAESKAATDFAPNLNSMVDQGCNLVISVGFLLKDATEAAAKKNPDVNFATIDDNEIKAKNVKPITFNTAQASFLAGYAAASYSKTGVVGTYGGMKIPTVTIFMTGFAQGVEYFNKQKNKDVKVAGWTESSQDGLFTGAFAADVTAKNDAQQLIDQNADVIMPVGGPIYQSAIQAIKDSGKDIAMIGVDSDGYELNPSDKSMFFTSVLKDMRVSTSTVVQDAGKDKFSSEPYVGTLKNKGVGIAPFHDYSGKVDSSLQGELDSLKQDIIDGKVKVEGPKS